MKTIACISGIFAALALSPLAQAMEVPESVTVPKGNEVAMETVGVGKIKWACEAKDDGTMGWVFKGPDAALNDADGKQAGAQGREHVQLLGCSPCVGKSGAHGESQDHRNAF